MAEKITKEIVWKNPYPQIKQIEMKVIFLKISPIQSEVGFFRRLIGKKPEIKLIVEVLIEPIDLKIKELLVPGDVYTAPRHSKFQYIVRENKTLNLISSFYDSFTFLSIMFLTFHTYNENQKL